MVNNQVMDNSHMANQVVVKLLQWTCNNKFGGKVSNVQLLPYALCMFIINEHDYSPFAVVCEFGLYK